MKIGYISRRNLELNPQLTEKFKFIEGAFIRRVSSRSDRVYTKILCCPVDYEEIVENAKIMKENSAIILVAEPFLLDDELREKAIRWVEWANHAKPEEYDLFVEITKDGR